MGKDTLFNISMFILRIVIGVIFFTHGAQKLIGMFNGIGLVGTTKMVEGMGFSAPYFVAIVWASIEFLGGIFLILGIMARWSASLIAITVLITMVKINLEYGFFIQSGGVEYGLLMVAACIPLILLGGGSWSVWDI